MKVRRRAFRILAPTAILGYGFPLASLTNGLERNPDLIAVDAGSTDPGPYYLGAGKSFTDRLSVQRDLTALVKAAVGRGIPLVVGTAGGSGAAPHMAWCRDIVEQIAHQHQPLQKSQGDVAENQYCAGQRHSGQSSLGAFCSLGCGKKAIALGSESFVLQRNFGGSFQGIGIGCIAIGQLFL